MATKNSEGRINFARFGKRSKAEIEADAAAEMAAAGVTHNWTIMRIHRDGVVTEIYMPKVKQIRAKLGLTQAEFAKRFRLRLRTIQQWEQRRAVPDSPAILLLRAIEADPAFMARVAAEIERPA
jgi:DNA-binding transcriptional regulator YiaG